MENNILARILNVTKLLMLISDKKIECVHNQEYEKGVLLRDLEKILVSATPTEDFLDNIASVFDEVCQADIPIAEKEWLEKLVNKLKDLESQLNKQNSIV